MITAVFEKDNNFVESENVWQWDYGQVLEIHGLALPPAIEIHFGIERGNSTITRIGSSLGGVTAVNIPDALLRQSNARSQTTGRAMTISIIPFTRQLSR